MLILAGVSINLVIGQNGIITKSAEAKIETRGAQVEDLVELYKSDNELSEYSSNVAQTEEELLEYLKNKKLVEDNELNTENKTITIGTRVISYALPEKTVDRTALKFLVNSGEDGIVVLPVAEVYYGEGGYEVEWGDGTTGQDETDADTKETKIASLDVIKIAEAYPGIAHTYVEKNKEYVVTITGICHYIDSYYSYTTRDKIIEVLQWGETGLENIWLSDCVNLRKIASPTASSFVNIIDFEGTFEWCTSLTSIPTDLFANCPNVTDFSNAFLGCTSLVSIPADLFANCPNVADFSGAFYYCTNLTGNAPELWTRVPDGEANEYIGTPDGQSCFGDCSNLTNYEQIPEYWKSQRK